MKMTHMFASTRKDISEDEVSINARLLIRAGFVEKVMAGVYAYLPLGLRALRNIEQIVREEMDAIGGEELLLPALHPKELWETTGRWNDLDVLYKVTSAHKKEYALGPTHEEVIVPLAKQFIHSYRDLPRHVYQIQDKFRDEPRAKAGLLRGREFLMKDLYSFHADPKDLEAYYDIAQKAYAKVFERCGLDAKETEASGGSFSKLSHEYQVFTPSGEDIVFSCGCGYAVNEEIADVKEGDACPSCKKGSIEKHKAIEVGNIFKLNTKYSEPFELVYTDANGKSQPVYMGCYGIGISRLLAAVVEVHHDDKGIVWPDSVAPYHVHVVQLGDDADVQSTTKKVVKLLDKKKIAFVHDDRLLSAGHALADADLMGAPWRVVVSSRSLKGGGVEVTARETGDSSVVSVDELLAELS